MKRILQGRDDVLANDCLEVIADRQYLKLAPDVKRYRDSLDLSSFIDRESWFVCAKCLFAIEKDTPTSERDGYLAEIRRGLFERKELGVPFRAYSALLAAQKYQHADIKADLLALAKGQVMMDSTNGVIANLFNLYGDSLTETEVGDLLGSWSNDEKMQRLVKRLAESRGPVQASGPRPEAPQAASARSAAPLTGPPEVPLASAPLFAFLAALAGLCVLAVIIATVLYARARSRPR
jgi:hypothetical protein